MRTLRQMTIAMIALGALVASTPAFAQSNTDSAPARLALPTATPLTISKSVTFLPQAEAPKQQGLGVFVQGGYVYQTTYTGGTDFDSTPQGFIAGIGFGGNKSGTFGIGVDLNYVWTNNSDSEVKTQYLNIPVYGRINIGGHNTKNAFTFYIPFGWYFDINLSSKIADFDVKDAFESFQTGPLVGAGFEVYRIGIEARGQWAVSKLVTDGSVFGTSDAKQFTFIVLLKVRLN